MSKTSDTVRSIICLYTKIPEYSEVKHLANAEFINKIEKLKEEFRTIRSSLNDDSDDGVDWLSESTTKKLQISSKTKHKHTLKGKMEERQFSNFDISRSIQPNLFVRSCELHRNPVFMYYRPKSTESLTKSISNLFTKKTNSNNLRIYDNCHSEELSENFESSASASLSHWSSSPEISTLRTTDYQPPQNIEKRLLLRNKLTSSEDVLVKKKQDFESSKPFVAHPVPSHVSKPLFGQIMLKNEKRSQRVREQSKRKLMAQMKPFSFSEQPQLRSLDRNRGLSLVGEVTSVLNNSKAPKLKKNTIKNTNNIKINNNFLDAQLFKANPAPPRTRALMSALRFKEQQEYRELKRQLRAEALMKLSSLPPSMAARNKYRMRNFEKVDNTQNSKFEFDDEDRVSEDSMTSNKDSNNRKSAIKSKCYQRSHTSGLSISHISKMIDKSGIFESTSNDNNASRLRVQAAKKKEKERYRREEVEQIALMKNEEKRHKLRNLHSEVWRHACSYSSKQDIRMRRELRMAASILERDCFKKDMSTMLNRVSSAPLLLEGVRERKFEPCTKHKQEIVQLSNRTNTRHRVFEPKKYCSRINWTSHGEDVGGSNLGGGNSETAAVAEGSLTQSDNESIQDIQWEPNEVETTMNFVSGNTKANENVSNENETEDETIKIEAEVDKIIGFMENRENIDSEN